MVTIYSTPLTVQLKLTCSFQRVLSVLEVGTRDDGYKLISLKVVFFEFSLNTWVNRFGFTVHEAFTKKTEEREREREGG